MSRMENARRDGLIVVFLGATVVLVILGYLLSAKSEGAVHDFVSSYYAARCLIEHSDPYSETDLLRTYNATPGQRPLNDPEDRVTIARYVYPPSAFAVMVPFGILPWRSAHILWAIVSSFSLIFAAILAWELGADRAPILCGCLIAYMLANSEILLVLANPSALMISMCVIAVWCFVRERWVVAGIICLALALALKPQGAGLVWLYFLLAGGIARKRAIQALLVSAVISLPFIVWTWAVSPHWIHELQWNIRSFAYRGGPTDPGPASSMPTEFLDLQVVFSRLRDRPAFYNSLSYLVVAPLLLAWAAITVRARESKENVFYGIGAIAPLSLLPIYHHFYDTKLLLLTIPALALVSARRDRLGLIAILLTAVSFFVTGDLSHWLITHAASKVPSATLSDVLAVFPAPMILLLTGCFYLWIYWQTSGKRSTTTT